MATKNPSCFSVREILNQQSIIPFRTSQIAASGANNYISGNGGTYTFHASGFVNRANVHEIIMVGNGLAPTNFNVEFFMTSSLVSSERQYYYSNINTRAIDSPTTPIKIFDNNATGTLHGRITNNATTSGMWVEYIDLKYNRLLEIS